MYHAGDTMISPSVNVRDLGIFLDSMLDWRFHYSKIVSKAKQLCGWILCTFRTRDKTTMLTLYNALVRSRLEYCCEIWSPHLNKDINYIENIQRSFTFKISGMKEFNYWQRLKKLKLMSLQRRREKMIVSHVWKIKNGHFPNSIDLQFKLNKRSNSMKAVLKPMPQVRGRILTLFEKSFVIEACKLWNILPSELTHSTSKSSFTFLLNKFLSSVNDEPPIPGYPYKNNNSLLEQCL